MSPKLPGAEDNVILQALRDAGRRFMGKTEAWAEWLNSIVAADYKQHYPLTHGYSAEIQRVLEVLINSAEMPVCDYAFLEVDRLQIRSDVIPSLLDDRLLKCGAGLSTMATWQAITAGSAKFSIDGTTYSVVDRDFSTCSDMDDVAEVIQTGLREEMDDNTGFVRWDDRCAAVSAHFVVYTENGEVSYLTAGASGTDISGASHMNGLSDGTGVELGPHLQVKVVFRPQFQVTEIPAWLLDQCMDGIMAGACADLFGRPKMPWTDQSLAAEYTRQYNDTLGKAMAEVEMQNKTGSLDFG